jgi:hypothetical protein
MKYATAVLIATSSALTMRQKSEVRNNAVHKMAQVKTEAKV